METCKYCKGKVCDGKRKTIAEWNKCPKQKAEWEVETSIVYWILDIITLGIAKPLIYKIKINQYIKL